MHNEKSLNENGHDLRQRAEVRAARVTSPPPENLELLSAEEIRRLIHELQVHQLELEMQNEELRRAQDKLDLARARYFDLYDLAPVGYCTLSEKNLIQETNLTAAALLDVPRAMMVGQAMNRYILAEDQDLYYRLRKQLLETGQAQVGELRLLRTNNPPFWARLDATVTRDEEGGPPVVRLVLSDVSARKKAEEEQGRLQAQLNQVQKMESIGRLAGGVAHDFNNMLGIILGYTELAQEGLGPGQPLFDELEAIRNAAERAAALTRQMLTFARKQIVAPVILDFNQAVAGMLLMMRRLIGENIQLQWKPGIGLWPVKMDPTQIDQILANLCVNSRDAITGVGEIKVETSNVIFDATSCAGYPGCTPGEYVALIISDNGCGMDKETLANVFEPFFTTKEMGKGTGLGLATVFGIVKQNNGFIYPFSRLGQGTTFNVYLPRHPVKNEQVQEVKQGPAELARGVETILLVEDDVTLLEMTTHMLERLGYTVLAAALPSRAVEVAKKHADSIHLLVTDVIMPEMNGQELTLQLRSLRPELKHLFMSGYTAGIIGWQGVLKDDSNFIQKPFAIQHLSRKVREVLDRQ